MAVAIAATIANFVVQRGGGPYWLGIAASGLVAVGGITWVEYRRHAARARARAADPDLRLYHAAAPRARLLELLRALERVDRPRAGVGVGAPPGETKLWIRHSDGTFEVHEFSVSASDAARVRRISESLRGRPGIRPAAPGENLPNVLTFRAVLAPEPLNALVLDLLDAESPAADGQVMMWWSVTLDPAPADATREG